ncbi:Equilibrative Nucleoside Transporter (ENT) Family [Thraustotheca clavata]|uniref:Equilibrative Nucleoside Transporter (ENT) Family n=1 Tax=Thraustotheca clavata TaxID=74557 RepID=A0A1V9YX15_9STRA|nr:Equilibrative Nucleoside Transporter (ENT) Family [Thraustotheca clavata]
MVAMITGTTLMGGYVMENYKRMNPLTPPGQLVEIEVDGQKQSVHAQFFSNEKSQVVVVLDGSAGETSFDFSKVAPKLAEFATVLAIDRPGLGFSTPGSLPRTAEKISSEYLAVLDKLQINGQLVLVGHGNGGYNMRQLALDIPSSPLDLTVSGMVLVDSLHESVRGNMNAISPAINTALHKREDNPATLLKYSHWGLLRLVYWMQYKKNVARYQPSAIEYVDSFAPSPPHRRGVVHEAEAASAIEEHFLNTTQAPLECPLVVLSHDVKGMFSTMLFEPDVNNEMVAAMENEWKKGQCALLSLSKTSVHRIVAGSDIPHDKPEELIAATLAIVNEIQGKKEGGVQSLASTSCPIGNQE